MFGVKILYPGLLHLLGHLRFPSTQQLSLPLDSQTVQSDYHYLYLGVVSTILGLLVCLEEVLSDHCLLLSMDSDGGVIVWHDLFALMYLNVKSSMEQLEFVTVLECKVFKNALR
ncbi:hypothetical protein Tco_1403887, partial [Tanacetum coccineum]